jgi:hypothetical protein
MRQLLASIFTRLLTAAIALALDPQQPKVEKGMAARPFAGSTPTSTPLAGVVGTHVLAILVGKRRNVRGGWYELSARREKMQWPRQGSIE